MHLDAVEFDRIRAALAARSSGDGEGLEAAQNLGRVVEVDLVRRSGLESSPVDLAAGFDHQRKIALFPQPLNKRRQTGSAVLAR